MNMVCKLKITSGSKKIVLKFHCDPIFCLRVISEKQCYVADEIHCSYKKLFQHRAHCIMFINPLTPRRTLVASFTEISIPFKRVRSFWSRSLRSGTLRSRSFGSEAKFGQFGRGHYGPGHFGRGHICLYFRH